MPRGPRRPRRAGRLTLALVSTLVAGVLGGPAVAANAASGPLRYVALGDSYSAASGVLPLDLTAPPQCLRSTRNFSHVIAARIGAQLTDVTCGGADTSDFTTSQYPGVAPQLDAVKSDTQLVTMTIGGNDSGVFIDTIINCGTAGLSTLGQGSPCKDRYGSTATDILKNTTYPAVVAALEAVKAKAPKAKVAVLGYPWIMPPTEGCFPQMPLARGDVPYVRNIQATLNDVVKRAASAAKAKYVDFSSVSEGHDACKPIGVRWIEPVVAGTNPVIVHPNALGESEMAARAMKVLGLD